MIPHLNLNLHKKKSVENKTPKEKEKSKRSEKSARATGEEQPTKSGRNKVISMLRSRADSFTTTHDDEKPGSDAANTTDSNYTVASPRTGPRQSKFNVGSRRRGKEDAPPTSPELQWTQGAKVATPTKPPVLHLPSDQDYRLSSPEDLHRTVLTSPRERSTDTLQRLLNEGNIVEIETDTGDLYLIQEGTPEHELRTACLGLPLLEPTDFARACTLLEAALPHITNKALHQQLMEHFTPAFLQHCADGLPVDRWHTLCNAIQPYFQEALEAPLKAPAKRLTELVSQRERAIKKLLANEHPKALRAESLMLEMHELLQEAIDLGEKDLAHHIVVTARRLHAGFEGTSPKFAGLQATANALYGSWQKSLLEVQASPAFKTLFDGPTVEADASELPQAFPASRCASLVQIHGAGAQVRFACDAEAFDPASVQAVAQVCQQWWNEGMTAEANALLLSVLDALKDPGLLQQLADQLGGKLLRLLHAKPSAALRCAKLLIRMHQRTPLSAGRLAQLVGWLGDRLPMLRYDAEGLREIHALANRLQAACDAHTLAVPPTQKLAIAQLVQASRDALLGARDFNRRWEVKRGEQGTIEAITPLLNLKQIESHLEELPKLESQIAELRTLGSQPELLHALERRAQPLRQLKAHVAELAADEKQATELDTIQAAYDKETSTQHWEDESLRYDMMKLARLNYTNPGDLSKEQKDRLADQSDWINRRNELWKATETQDSRMGAKRLSKFLADIDRFLEDPMGPPWATVQKAIQAVCTEFNWAPSADHWLRWSLLAAARGETAALETRLRQAQRNAQQGHSFEEGMAQTKELVFRSLMELMDRHVDWPTIQAALQAIDGTFKWTLSDSQLATLSLAQARRGDPAPLMALLSGKRAIQLPPDELKKLLGVLNQAESAPRWTKLRELSAPLFDNAPPAFQRAYKDLLVPTSEQGNLRAVLEDQQPSAEPLPWRNAIQGRSDDLKDPITKQPPPKDPQAN